MRKCLTTDLVKAVFVVAVESSELKVIELDPSYVAIITLFSPLDVVTLFDRVIGVIIKRIFLRDCEKIDARRSSTEICRLD